MSEVHPDWLRVFADYEKRFANPAAQDFPLQSDSRRYQFDLREAPPDYLTTGYDGRPIP